MSMLDTVAPKLTPETEAMVIGSTKGDREGIVYTELGLV